VHESLAFSLYIYFYLLFCKLCVVAENKLVVVVVLKITTSEVALKRACLLQQVLEMMSLCLYTMFEVKSFTGQWLCQNIVFVHTPCSE